MTQLLLILIASLAFGPQALSLELLDFDQTLGSYLENASSRSSDRHLRSLSKTFDAEGELSQVKDFEFLKSESAAFLLLAIVRSDASAFKLLLDHPAINPNSTVSLKMRIFGENRSVQTSPLSYLTLCLAEGRADLPKAQDCATMFNILTKSEKVDLDYSVVYSPGGIFESSRNAIANCLYAQAAKACKPVILNHYLSLQDTSWLEANADILLKAYSRSGSEALDPELVKHILRQPRYKNFKDSEGNNLFLFGVLHGFDSQILNYILATFAINPNTRNAKGLGALDLSTNSAAYLAKLPGFDFESSALQTISACDKGLRGLAEGVVHSKAQYAHCLYREDHKKFLANVAFSLAENHPRYQTKIKDFYVERVLSRNKDSFDALDRDKVETLILFIMRAASKEQLATRIATLIKRGRYSAWPEPLLGEPTGILALDQTPLVLSHAAMVTNANFLMFSSPYFQDSVTSSGTHGDLVLSGINEGGYTGMRNLRVNFSQSLNGMTCDNLKGNVKYKSDEVLAMIESTSSLVLNISCSYDEYRKLENYQKYEPQYVEFLQNQLFPLATKNKIFLVKSAGNRAFSVNASEDYTRDSEYGFIVASAERSNDGDLKLHSKSARGNLVDFAAFSTGLELPNLFSLERPTQKVTESWGGTSYSTGVVSGLIGKILNYLPPVAREFPEYIKWILVSNGIYSSELVGKLRFPVVVNPEATLAYLRNHLFFDYEIDGHGNYLIKCDKRLMAVRLQTGVDTNCASSDPAARISIPKAVARAGLDVVFLRVYSNMPPKRCQLNIGGRHILPNGIVSSAEGTAKSGIVSCRIK